MEKKNTAQRVKAHYLWAESGEYNAAFTWSQAESRQERLLDGTGKTKDRLAGWQNKMCSLQIIKYHHVIFRVIDNYKKQLVLDIKL